MNNNEYNQDLMNIRKQEFRSKKKKINKYLEWLEIFTKKNNNINTYYMEEDNYSQEDIENIYNLGVLFELLEDYAKENYISSKLSSLGEYYSVKYNDIGYNIGIDMYYDGLSYYCDRLKKPEKGAFNLKKAIKGEKLSSTKDNKHKLKELKKYLNQLLDEKVPENAILQTTQKVLKKTKTIDYDFIVR